MAAPSSAPASASRRRFIALVGGGAVFAATAPLAGCAAGAPIEATEAWRSAAAEKDPRRFVLAHALLAPNPHNRQPWLADLSVPGQIGLVCDGGRLLPETDPFGRQVLIGCGAFLELAALAAARLGLAATVTLFPDGAPGPAALPAGTKVALLRLGALGSAAADPLFEQVPHRRTNRNAYANDRALPAALPAQWAETARRFGQTAGVATEPAAMGTLRRISREAFEIECVTPRTWLESAHLMRIGPAAIARHRDGISMTALLPRALHAVGLFDPLEVPQPGSTQLGRVMEHWQASETGSGYLWLASAGNGRAQQIDAGRAWARLHLQATAAGVDLQPLSQALQEFAEMRGPFLAIHRALGVDPAAGTVQMFARVGYALAPVEPSPRRGLAALLQA